MKAFWCKRGHLLAGAHVKLIREGAYLKRRCTICMAITRRAWIIRRVRGAA